MIVKILKQTLYDHLPKGALHHCWASIEVNA